MAVSHNLLIFAAKELIMRKLVWLYVLMLVGCVLESPSQQTLIERVCQEFASDTLTIEEAAHWDSMNATMGGYLLIRGAERNLDTIVNHLHLIFITDK